MWTSLRVGALLGIRQIQRASIWTTLLIIFIMTLTFLNLVGVSGILVGLIEGSVEANRNQYTGNVFISTPSGDPYIKDTNSILQTLGNIKEVDNFSYRYIGNASAEANYKTRRDQNEVKDTVGAQVAGIDMDREDSVTNLSKYVVEGEYLTNQDTDSILVGSNLLRQYAADFGEGFSTLDDVSPGVKIRLTYGDKTKEYTVKGIVDSKVNETSLRMFMVESEFVRFFDRYNLNVNEVAVDGREGLSEDVLKNIINRSLSVQGSAKIQTAEESIPQFLNDIKIAFGILGNIIGGIGIVVASITIFIIIFINAITRRKYIGILKAIGIKARSIQFAYVLQSIFYAFSGSVVGVSILYGILVPLVAKNPIDFPFSDGILVAPVSDVMTKVIILMIVTMIAGFIPAWMIIRKNTLDSILGR
ncbi:MAG: FtsX-like permease family protein [Candidatus Paceibacterota bacterium]